MYLFEVKEMTCGHCERAIRNEIEDLDPQAKVTVDLEQKTVSVESSQQQQAIQTAIEEAGYAATAKAP